LRLYPYQEASADQAGLVRIRALAGYPRLERSGAGIRGAEVDPEEFTLFAGEDYRLAVLVDGKVLAHGTRL
jgi:hypothetical protein